MPLATPIEQPTTKAKATGTIGGTGRAAFSLSEPSGDFRSSAALDRRCAAFRPEATFSIARRCSTPIGIRVKVEASRR